MDSLADFVRKKLAEIKTKSLYRQIVPTAHIGPGRAERGGKTYVSFSGNDYLGLTLHPAVVAAAKAATEQYGTGAGASRLVTGDHPLYGALEGKIAAFKEAEAALVFGSGYLANLGVIPALAGEGDLVLADRLSHACLFAGARLSRAEYKIFRHNDLEHAEEILAKSRARATRCLILTEGVFSMEGDRAPVRELAALARRFDAWLLVDDAHGLGVVEGGKGSTFSGGQKLDVPLQMGTLSKAAASVGGYLAADAEVIDFLKNRARTLIFTTALPPAAVAAAMAALDLIAGDPALCAMPMAKARLFASKLGLPEPQSAIVPIVLSEPELALEASRKLLEEGYLVSAIRPPTVPEGEARLRFAFSAAHTDEDVVRLSEAVRRAGILR
jgi:8-amino-7-oxononanoate synthase